MLEDRATGVHEDTGDSVSNLEERAKQSGMTNTRLELQNPLS